MRKVIIDPPLPRIKYTQIHTLSQKSMGAKCNFHANFKHTYKKISIFSVIVTQTLCFPCLTFSFIYTFILISFPTPSLCLFLMCWLNAGFVHWPECTGTQLLYPPVLVALFIHVTSCPFASSSSVLRRDTDALDSRHIWVAQALIVRQLLRQHH